MAIRATPASFAALVLASLVTVAACDIAGPTGPTPVPTGAVGSPLESTPTPDASRVPSGSPQLTPVPGGVTPAPTSVPTPSATRPTTTQTDWGEIVDSLPIDFPIFPGSHEATGDPTQGPISGAFSAPSDGTTVTEWYQQALERAGYSTRAVSGPLEDGSMVIDSLGGSATCLVQTTIRPLSGTTLVTVLYGAGCLDR